MQKLIRNQWSRAAGDAFSRAHILDRTSCPEGLDVDRFRFLEAGGLPLDPEVPYLFSVIAGRATIEHGGERFVLEPNVHVYLPPDAPTRLQADAKTELVRVGGAEPKHARGKRLLVRDETFLSASATDAHALRWILTPQYLSRRIFLHHDPFLLSESGHPVSWFRTTMFDVTGLPINVDGESVFKMSYNSRTEFNVCYDVRGEARVRMAHHPYRAQGVAPSQAWGPWMSIDSDTTYHLNEAAGSEHEEAIIDVTTGARSTLRNKHEVASNGSVSLFCMFDPAPTGVERHRPGEYSDYEPLAQVTARAEYIAHQKEIVRFDAMVDVLSRAKAKGELDKMRATPEWSLYLQGAKAQRAIEQRLFESLGREASRRDRVIQPWMLPPPPF